MIRSKRFFVVILVCFQLNQLVGGVDVEESSFNRRESRKLFGGYRITPRFCKPTREPTPAAADTADATNICMFNHECLQRNGHVVGACMDGFLFGACCRLPAGTAGELMDADDRPAPSPDNGLLYTKSPDAGYITSSGVSQITNALLQSSVLPTAQDDVVVQISEQDQFGATGVTHPTAPETYVVNQGSNDINGDEFKPEERKTTYKMEETTRPYVPDVSPYIHISISNAPPYYTPTSNFQKPVFRPKPQRPSDADKYVLVPTINHGNKPNKTHDIDSIVNIIQMLDESSTHGGHHQAYTVTTTKRPPSTSYVFSATPTRRPGYDADKRKTSQKPSTTPPKRTTKPSSTTSKRPSSTKPTKTTSKKPSTTASKKPTYQYVSSSTFRPAQSTLLSSVNSFQTTTSKRPPSTSYVYSSTISKRPLTSTSISPYTITKVPAGTNPSPPTLIVLGPLEPTRYTTPKPSTYSSSQTINPPKRPVSVTINNHVTQNIYSTSEKPSPTILITPKPNSANPTRPSYSDFDTESIEIETSANDLINFPPVRNPNLNMSIPVFDEADITTPDFVEDDALNTKVESFVNKIIASLQEPFQGLRDVVYNKNKTAFLETTTKKPTKKQGTKKPSAKPATSRKPTSSTSSKRPTTTTTVVKRTKPTKKVTTTPLNFIEADESSTEQISQDYRTQCGIRPLVRSGRIVGGKGAAFGEFPWQVLVRESTWLGLFTKNKCGGVLISSRFVMTAAHCQPGFLASLVAVFGEFDISGELESKRSLSRNVKRVIVHRQYDAATFENDLALLELEHPVQFDEHIVPVCLPREHEDFTGRMATVTGWGRLKYGGGVPSVLQEVQVPIMENSVCQEMFRTAGHSKVILESFLCAGYANGQKDSCEGDSGGPLVLQRPDGRYQLAGTVSHGIKCAAPYLPGVYMRTTYYKPWIESITGVH